MELNAKDIANLSESAKQQLRDQGVEPEPVKHRLVRKGVENAQAPRIENITINQIAPPTNNLLLAWGWLVTGIGVAVYLTGGVIDFIGALIVGAGALVWDAGKSMRNHAENRIDA